MYLQYQIFLNFTRIYIFLQTALKSRKSYDRKAVCKLNSLIT